MDNDAGDLLREHHLAEDCVAEVAAASTTMTSPATAMSSALWTIRLSPGRVFAGRSGTGHAASSMVRPERGATAAVDVAIG